MSFYIDTSFIGCLLFDEPRAAEASIFWCDASGRSVVSDWVIVELGAVISCRLRNREIDSETATRLLSYVDKIKASCADYAVTSDDLRLASDLVRSFDLMLTAADALHLAAAANLGATLVTFDRRLAAAAARRLVTVAPI